MARAERDPLPLTAGKLLRTAIEIGLEPENIGGFCDALRGLVLADAGIFSGKRDIVANGHMRVERVVLEDHGHVAIGRAGRN